MKTDFGGLPIAFHLTGGEASDSRNFETLLDIGPDLNPRAALGDKGYDSKSNRDAARQRGICPAIPYRSNRPNPRYPPAVQGLEPEGRSLPRLCCACGGRWPGSSAEDYPERGHPIWRMGGPRNGGWQRSGNPDGSVTSWTWGGQ